MVDLMYIKLTWLSSYISHRTHMTIISMVVKSMQNLDTFTRRKDRYFFHKLSTKYGQDDILDFFVANFLSDSKRWIGNLLQMMVEVFTWIIKNGKNPLLTILNKSVELLLMTLAPWSFF